MMRPVEAAANSALVSLIVQQNVFVQVLVAIAAICICTRLISGHRFETIKAGRNSGIAPPTLPHWLPGLRHALHMAYNAKRFVAKSL